MEQYDYRKIKFTGFDFLLEAIGILALCLLLILPYLYADVMPERIPRHFNFYGQPDAWCGKWSVYVLQGIGLVLFVMMTILNRFPGKFNYFVAITDQNALIQYQISTRMVRYLKTVVICIFFFLLFKSIQISIGEAENLGQYFLLVVLIAVFGPVIYYLRKSFRNK